ncbi:protein adenylyltransferase SelO family protein [Pelagibacterium sediminicola]|uniref:protein adenylyltransferase SelO family protein n=1 Tax=Pelagibacterium sediminicola TaxID=2248761 RepID=UPI000E31543C|nr:YdiU family protein [Pelagibacterium sediminicola]
MLQTTALSDWRPARVHEALGRDFFDPVEGADFSQLVLRYRNRRWAERMGLGGLTDAQWLDHFGRFVPLPGSFETPLALRYHGHQFHSYNPQLGDGRGFLFAQGFDREGMILRDFGTKGSGVTPWSRGGDGRLTLKGGVREVLAAEMLEALGVETSKGFSLIETGESLYRNDEPSPTRAAVLVRLSHSHIRIGTFQRLAFFKDEANLQRLVEHVIAHYYPHLNALPQEDRVPALLGAVAGNVARVGAQWIAAGFVHGVLNSDNINITGESFDYGPWRFLLRYDPGFVAAYFDETGLYAFGRQPDALAWNLTRLAETLVPLASVETLEPELNRFWPAFQNSLAQAVLRRLGLKAQGEEKDRQLVSALYSFMAAAAPDYERVFFDWRGGGLAHDKAMAGPLGALYRGDDFAPVLSLLKTFEPCENARAHPYFGGPAPRTLLIDEVEAIWAPIAANDDWSQFLSALDDIAAMRAAYAV